ncbi:MAG: methyltransferase domain-containing protein [Clostridia bacterium]|nr:methyltransferase domain-containing protein [Clostridia bacterium]
MENRDIEYFDRLWKESSPKDGMKHTRETWDRLAENWNGDPPEVAAIKAKKCEEITDFLLERGAISKDSLVIDVGCGTGGYAVNMAKYAKHITCSDISPKMLAQCKALAESRGLDNMDFVECDFFDYDIDAAGWRNGFDLVFTSLTPAMSGLASVEKINSMSRNWCFNNSFVYRKDNLRNAVMENVFGKEVTNRWGNSSAYCLFNILWHMGLTPQMNYSREIIEYDYDLTPELAQGITANIIRDRAPTEREVKLTFDYLEKNMAKEGKVRKITDSLYSWILWNVNGEKEGI